MVAAGNVTYRLVAILLLPLLLFLVYLAATAGLADLRTIAAQKLLHKNQLPVAQRQEVIDAAINLRTESVALFPGNADYQLDLALLYQSYSHLFGRSDQYALNQSIEHARQAVILRGAWARAWAVLAITRYRASGFDAFADVALTKARQLGPWEPDVVSRVAWIAMTAWGELPAEQRQQTAAYFVRLMAYPQFRRVIQRTASETGWSGFLKRLEREGME